MSIELAWYLISMVDGILGVLGGIIGAATVIMIAGLMFGGMNLASPLFDHKWFNKSMLALVLTGLLVLIVAVPLGIIIPTSKTCKELLAIHYGKQALTSDVVQDKLERMNSIIDKSLDKIEAKLDDKEDSDGN